MAEAFDPDKYLQEKVKVPPNSIPFDPDKYLQEKNLAPKEESLLDKQFMGMSGRGLIKGGLSTLPSIGMIGGGMIGGSAGLASPIPGGAAMGSIGGAGLGSAAGESLKQLGEKYLLGEEGPKSSSAYLKDIGVAGAEGALGEVGGQVLGAGTKAIAESKLGKKALEGLGTIGAKIGNTLTGVSENEIKTYAKNADEIKAMAKSSDNNIGTAADEIRTKYYKDIDNTRKEMNNQISSALQSSNKTVDASPIISKFADASSKINQKLYPEQVKEIDGLIEKVRSLGTEKDGKLILSVQDANDVKQFLQDKASISYRNPGQIFALGKDSAKAAKSAAGAAREIVNAAVPEVGTANKTLAQLHEIEDNMNMNLISAGKPEAGLMAAGTRGNVRNANYLKELGGLTDTDMLGQADKLAAMRTFGSPALMAVDTTGKSAARMGLGAGLGYLSGGNKESALAGAALTSPAALRLAIDAGLIGKSALGSELGQKLMMRGLLGKSKEQQP